MSGRITELRRIRAALLRDEPGGEDAARRVGQALRGSGSTFGFPEITALGMVLETSADHDVLRRVEGLIAELETFTGAVPEDAAPDAAWLWSAVGRPEESAGERASTLAELWKRVGRASGRDGPAIAGAVARYFGLESREELVPKRSALSLVPTALMRAAHVVPLEEDATSVLVATSDPTSIRTELELRRVTGRFPVFVVVPPDRLLAALAEALGEVPPPAAERVDITEESGPGASGTILVVDDESSARLYIRSLLEKRGFRVVEAADGEEALARVDEADPVALVVADLNMPRRDGLELIWEMRDRPGLAHIPVIVVTGEVDQVLEMQLIEEGADDYVRKPLDPRLFLARVEATIRRAGG